MHYQHPLLRLAGWKWATTGKWVIQLSEEKWESQLTDRKWVPHEQLTDRKWLPHDQLTDRRSGYLMIS